MKASAFSDAQKAFILKQGADGVPVAEICRRAGIGQATVVDTFTRFSPVIDPRFTYRSENVVEALDRACARLGYPKAIRVDQGTEFVSRNLDLWAYAHGVTLDFSHPGKPTDNAFIEAFNGRFRAEWRHE